MILNDWVVMFVVWCVCKLVVSEVLLAYQYDKHAVYMYVSCMAEQRSSFHTCVEGQFHMWGNSVVSLRSLLHNANMCGAGQCSTMLLIAA